MLSVPCSSGEEPYSIALALLEAGLPASVDRDQCDRCERRGRAPSARRGCTARLLPRRQSAWKKYFVVTAHGLADRRERAALGAGGARKSAVRGFQPPREQYDVIFCRNLLIYFDERRAGARARDARCRCSRRKECSSSERRTSFAARRAGFAPSAGPERTFLFRLTGRTSVSRSDAQSRAARSLARDLPPRPAHASAAQEALPVASGARGRDSEGADRRGGRGTHCGLRLAEVSGLPIRGSWTARSTRVSARFARVLVSAELLVAGRHDVRRHAAARSRGGVLSEGALPRADERRCAVAPRAPAREAR